MSTKTESSKKSTLKKSFVRNTSQPKPKTVVISEHQIKGASELASSSGTSINAKTTSTKTTKNFKSRLNSPELNSALLLAKEIETVENIKPKKVKSVLDINKKKQIQIDEKVCLKLCHITTEIYFVFKASKQLNFPHDQPVYKDLIPLNVRPVPSQTRVAAREVAPPKDEEPSLSDFYVHKVLPEYSFEVTIEPPTNNKPMQHMDPFKLHRIMKSWE